MRSRSPRPVERGPTVVRVPGVMGGSPTIEGTRVRVSDVVMHWRLGSRPSMKRVVRALPHLTEVQVREALAYYKANRDEVDAEIHAEERLAEEYRGLRAYN